MLICDGEKLKYEHLSGRGRIIWKVLFHVLTWGIWLKRNQIIFEGKFVFLAKSIYNILSIVCKWVRCDSGTEGIRFEDLLFGWEGQLHIF